MITYSRNSLDLCGEWGFYPDAFGRFQRQKWYLNERRPDSAFPCYDKYTNVVTVPHSWNAQDPQLKFFFGTGVYLKEFSIENAEQVKKKNNIWLCFDGVNYHCDIYLNGKPAGTHDGGYSPFQINVTDLIEEKNTLWVAVDNANLENRVPSVIYDWWNDGGIYRKVNLVYTPKTWIENFRVKTSVAEDITVTLDVSLSGTASVPVEYTAEIPELGVSVSGRTADQDSKQLVLPRGSVTLWSPETPKLYKIVISAGEDRIEDEIGLRELKTVGNKICLNGSPIFLRGINFHDEYKENGRVPDAKVMDEAFRRFHDLNLNFIRMAHYPHCDEFVRRADREGFLLWAEIPVYWYMYWQQEGVYETAVRMMEEMIDRDCNRAAVMFWSVGNEMPRDNPEMHAGYLMKLADRVKELDDTRFVTYACSGFDMNETETGGSLIMPERFYEKLDVIGINNYRGFLDGTPEELSIVVNEYAKLGKPMIVSETGGTGERGNENGPEDIFSETRHADTVSRQLKTLLAQESLSGVSFWHFCDMRTPIYHIKNSNLECRFGFVDMNWKPKKAYAVLKKYYSEIKALK